LYIVSAAVGGFHNAGATSGTDYEAVIGTRQLRAPLGEHAGQGARVIIILMHRALFGNPRGTEKDYGVADALAAEMRERLKEFSENPDDPRIGRIEELFVEIRHRAAFAVGFR
jgi:hypothetical protein